jgi:hypothetical protein
MQNLLGADDERFLASRLTVGLGVSTIGRSKKSRRRPQAQWRSLLRALETGDLARLGDHASFRGGIFLSSTASSPFSKDQIRW